MIRSLLLSSIFSVGLAWSADGVTAESISLGQCAALSGSAAALGTNMNLGINACFKAVNAAGGINGRKLALVTADDQYDPKLTPDLTLKLIEQDKVFALIGYVGTPTGKVAIDIVQELKVPLVGLFTGAGIFRKPELKYIVNVRASYDQETEALVERLTKDLGAKSIAIVYQNDAFGQAGLSGTEAALKRRTMALAAKGTYERGTVAVKAGLADILAGKPDAVVMVGAYKPLAAFAKEARAAGLNVPLCTISFVGTEAFIAEAGAAGEGVAISQVMPSPEAEDLALAKQFRAALAAHDAAAKPTYGAFEGFVTATVLAEGLKNAGAEPTRDGLVVALEAMQGVDLGGFVIGFDPKMRQGSQKVWLTQVKAGKAVPVEALAK